MDTVHSHCTDEQMERFLNEQLGPADQSAIEEHLEECAACQQAMMAHAAQPQEWQEARDALQAAAVGCDASGLSLSATSDAGRSREVLTGMEAVLRSLAPTDDPRMLGRIGPFEVQGVIGSGGMGVVLKGFDPALNRTVAIKVLAPHLALSGSARRRFAREARAAAAVVHENVVAIHSVAEAGGLPYFVMPYIRGTSLERRLQERGPLGVTEILRIAWQTAAGLTAAHAQGLVHRDVKPANILLEDGVERLLLTDFGLARAVDDASLTRTGVIAGTPQYMSPEQARGETIDARSDLFSLGSVMYAMCTGRPPFRAETSYGILRRITDTEPRPIRDINPEIPDWLVAVIAKLHAKDLASRYASADEIAKLLEQCLAHNQQPTAVPLPGAIAAAEFASVETRLPATAAPPYSAPSRLSLLVGSTVVGLLVLAMAAGVLFHRHRTGRQDSPRPAVPSVVPKASQANGRPTADQAAPHAQLRQRITLSLDGAPLPQALRQLAQQLQTNIVLDEESIRKAGIDMGTPVSIHVQVPERASAVLKLILQPFRLGYTVEGRSIRVTTPENVETTLYVRVYSVGDLLTPAVGETSRGKDQAADANAGPLPQKPRHDFRSLIALITGTVEPLSWDGVGGPGRIEPFEARSSLVITQTQPIHEQIADLLDELRRPSARQPPKPAKSSAPQQPKGGGGSGGFFSTDAGFPRTPVPAISAATAVPSSQVTLRQDHVRFVALWQDAAQDLPMQRLPGLGHSCGGLWYLPDGKTLLSTFGGAKDEGGGVPENDPRYGQVIFWDTSTWAKKAILDTGARCFGGDYCPAISPDGSRLAVVVGPSGKEAVAVWDITSAGASEKPMWRQERPAGGLEWTQRVYSIAFSPDGAGVASIEFRYPTGNARARESSIAFYDADTGRPRHGVPLRSSTSRMMAFAPDGKTLALLTMPARQKWVLQLVDTSTWKIARGLDQNPLIQLTGYPIQSMRFLPDGRVLAASADNTVLLYDTQTSQFEILGKHPTRGVPGYFGGTGTMVSALALSRDGRLLATGGHEDRPTIRLWDLTTRRQVHKLEHPAGHYVYGLAFSPDGSQLISGVNWDEDGQGACCLWQLPPQTTSHAGLAD